MTYTLKPLSEIKWTVIKKAIESERPLESALPKDSDENKSVVSLSSKSLDEETGVVVDPKREIRAKLYMGQVSRLRSSRACILKPD